MSDQVIIRCADICDDEPDAQVCELMFYDFAKRACFHGEAVTFSTYEDNKGIREVLARGGNGKVLVVMVAGRSAEHCVAGTLRKKLLIMAGPEWCSMVPSAIPMNLPNSILAQRP